MSVLVEHLSVIGQDLRFIVTRLDKIVILIFKFLQFCINFKLSKRFSPKDDLALTTGSTNN